MTKNKLIRTLVVVMMLLCTVAILFACSDADVDYSDGDGDKTPSTGGIVITFMDDGEEVHTTTDPQEALSYTPEEKEGYVFKGWFLDAEFNDEFTKLPTKSVTVYAKWEVQTFKVTFKHNDGSTIQVNGEDYQIVVYGQSAVAPEDPTLEGFDFKGWDEDFSSVKSDLTVRAMFDTKKQDIVVFDDNGVEIKRVTAAIGSDITALYQTLYDDVENAIPGGLVLEALCVDPELTETYKVPTSGHTMPYTDLLLYTRVSLQDIEGLKLTANRNNFRYDTKGFTLTSSLYANSVITYSYEWYDAQASAVIAGENDTTLQVGCKDVGEYTYEVRVTASYKNLEKKYDSEVITVTVIPGTLEGMISVKGFNNVYNGKIRELDFEGTLPGDTITYRRVGETEYVPSFIKDAGDYNLETKIERVNYEPYEITGLDAVSVHIEAKVLTLTISLPIDNYWDGKYMVYYGSPQPLVQYSLQGFVDGENESFLQGDDIPNNPYDIGSPVGEYKVGLQENCWTSNNYTIESWPTVTLKVIKRPLTITLDPKTVVYGDEIPEYTVSLEGAIAKDVENIKKAIEYTCSYQAGSDVTEAGYTISATYSNNEYDINLATDGKIQDAVLTVLPKAVTVTPDSFTVTYGDPSPKYTFKAEGLVAGDTLEDLGKLNYDTNYKANKNTNIYSGVGNYYIKIYDSSLSNPNYDITRAEGTVKVNPKRITLSLATSTITYYDGYPTNATFASNLSANEGDLVGSDTIENSLKTTAQSFTSDYTIGKPVGIYDVVVGGYASKNYIINNNSAVVGKLEVVQRALTISVVGSTITYGDNLDVKVKYTGLVGDDIWAPEKAITGGSIVGGYQAGDDIGEHEVKIGNYTATNYKISYESGIIEVLPRALTIEARGFTTDPVAWNGSFDGTGLVAHGLFDGDIIAGTMQSIPTTKGMYVSLGELSNEFTWETGTFTITRGDVDKASNYTISYDCQIAIDTIGVFVTANTVVYDGTAHGLDIEYLDESLGFDFTNVKVLVSNDGVEYHNVVRDGAFPSEVAKINADTYRIHYKIMDGDAVEIEEVLEVEISPRPITIVVEDKEVTYGDALPTLTHKAIAYEDGKDAFAVGEDINTLGALTISIDGTVNEKTGRYDANFYTITASELSNPNYVITLVDGTLTINRKDLMVTVKDETITYGDQKPAFSATTDGFVDGEDLDFWGTHFDFNCAFTADTNGIAGEYDIVPDLSLNNYKIIAKNGTLVVNKKDITLTATNKDVTFGDVTPELTFVASGLATWDNNDTFGSYTIATAYTRGNAKGNYAITMTAESQKYNITKIVEGKVIVAPKKVEVNWSGNATTYTYDGTDRSSSITAQYFDIYGDMQDVSVAFTSQNANSTSKKKFQNAAKYDVVASTTDGNYILTNASIVVEMHKAKYSKDEHKYDKSFSGVYSPNKTLASDYALGKNGFYWVNGDIKPSVDKDSYEAYYNANPENYEDLPIIVNIIITPALISLDANNEVVNTTIEIETQIDVNSTNMDPTFPLNPTIWWIDGQQALGAGGNYDLTYSNGTSFKPGTHLTTMTFTSTNFKLNTADGSQDVNFFIKYKSVLVGNTLYTPEDALNTATSGTAIVKANTSFATQPEVISRYYNGSSYYTVKNGVTFLLPLSATDTTGFLNVGEAGSTEYSSHPAGTTAANPAPVLYITLTIPQNVTLTVASGATLTVGAVTGKQSHGSYQNAITGNYTVINLIGNINVNSATLNVYGYIKGAGKITTTGNTVVTENMYLSGWPGGSITAARFIGTDEVIVTEFMTGGTKPYTVENPVMFPFSQYEIRSIQSTMELQYGVSLRGVIKIATSKQEAMGITAVEAKINLAYFNIISSSTDESSGVLRMTSAGDKITKSFANDRVKFTLDGQVLDGYSTLNITVMARDISVQSQKVLFPIDGRTDIVVNSGTFTQNYQFKMMPGATLTVKSGAKYNLNGKLVTYKQGFVDAAFAYPSNRGDAKVFVEGTMNVNGSFGGDIYGVNGGKVVIASGATITSVKSVEGTGTMKTGESILDKAKIFLTFTESNSQYRNLTLNNASGTTSAAVGTTYTYNGTAWA